LRGYTKARHNTVNPVNKYYDMWVIIDVCGWEVVSNAPSSGDPIPATRSLMIEKGSART
jgi:hypothetical protein